MGADRDLLTRWYADLLAALGDPSDLAYLVDDPLDDGGLVVREAGGAPVGVAGRSRRVAGVVRVGAAHSPVDERYGRAAFTALCAAEAAAGLTVLVACRAGDAAAERRYRALGFVPAGARVTLDLRGPDGFPHAVGDRV